MSRQYIPDLRRLGALCEGNYARLQQLWGLAEDSEAAQFALHNGSAYLGRVSIERLQRERYTDTYYLEQVHNAGRWLNNPRMTVRVYHDARVAEVISCYRYRRIEAVHDYPNRFMHHPDEKVQINAFLADWLSYCLRFGHIADQAVAWPER
ncbi:DUF1249 domain-containing protein [Mangrovitalea sediminis]|uniref:DUF1249 domain-containing protein n=1 Tax=Mangrovitalea sediminis TaxID=1982043 RepID=UPI001D0D61AB|nr:DUF1249 domain-containing protein [Mangrovitalea sediminis]